MHLKPNPKRPKGLNTLCKEVKKLREQQAMDRSVTVTVENEENSSAGLFKLIFLCISHSPSAHKQRATIKESWLQILMSARSKDSHVLKVGVGVGEGLGPAWWEGSEQDEVQKKMLLHMYRYNYNRSC